MQPRSRQLQIAGRFTCRQVPANEYWIFGFNCDIKFPVAERRSRQRKFRPLRGRLRCGSAGQPDRNQIDVLEKMAICHCDVAADCRERERARELYVSTLLPRESIICCEE